MGFNQDVAPRVVLTCERRHTGQPVRTALQVTQIASKLAIFIHFSKIDILNLYLDVGVSGGLVGMCGRDLLFFGELVKCFLLYKASCETSDGPRLFLEKLWNG
jgi:hypothetical protein